MSATPDPETERQWSDDDSTTFIEVGAVYTPSRDELTQTLLDLIPADVDEPFVAVELGVGSGWLSAAILQRFPAARIVGLDGSSTMLRETEQRLRPYAGRYTLRPFGLEDSAWLESTPELTGADVRCFVSSLVIHHLDGAGKRELYQRLYVHLAAGGALLVADLVAPRSEWERRALARQWDDVVRSQSLQMTGSLQTYQRFVDDHWNLYEHPDPMDIPSTAPEHLQWLAEAGFVDANIFWQRAGHAIYGGYKAR